MWSKTECLSTRRTEQMTRDRLWRGNIIRCLGNIIRCLLGLGVNMVASANII